MNHKFFPPALALACLFGLAGCESSRYEPATVLPASAPGILPVQPEPSEQQLLADAAKQPFTPPAGSDWRSLFDGKSLAGWRVTDFQEGGSVQVRDGLLLFLRGDPFVGVNCTETIPQINYEVSLDAMIVAGGDFFCGLTFPVGDSFCSLIVGGWGGSVVGLSSLDGYDASENETTQFITFEKGRWYRIRLRVSETKIEAWVEQKKVADVVTTGRKLSLRFGEIDKSKPFGLASYSTSAAYRGIEIRPVTGPADPPR